MRVQTTLILVAAFVIGCGSSSEPPPSSAPPPPTSSAIPDPAPAQALGGLAPLRGEPQGYAEVVVGRRLFFEGRLSGDGTVTCATCHSLDHGGAEDRRVSTGIRGQQGPINAPTVLNAANNFVQFWDGRAATLEAQAAGPVANPLEMGADWSTVVRTIDADASYHADFAALYPGDPAPVTQDHITHAIATYERTLITPGRFDRFIGGDASAMSDDERRGYALFTSVGCTSCHTGPNVGGTMYQRMGLVRDWFAQVGRPLTDADNGRFNVTHDEADRHRFKVPTLRNVAFLGALSGDLPADARPPATGTIGSGDLPPITGTIGLHITSPTPSGGATSSGHELVGTGRAGS